MKNQFEVAAGSVIGRDHLKDLGWRNNQDTVATVVGNGCIALVVADGCSASEQSTASHNEVGAQIGCKLIAKAVSSASQSFQESVEKHGIISAAFEMELIRMRVLEQIKQLAVLMGGDFHLNIRDYFLFTLVGALITPVKAFVFSIGDGVVFVNGELIRIGPFPNNQPPYLGYGLVKSTIDPSLCKFTFHAILPTDEITSILVGTDGVGELIDAETCNLPGKNAQVGPVSQFWEDDRYFTNSDQVRRKLALVNCEITRVSVEGELVRFPGLLKDDTTLAVIRRRKQSTGKE